MKKKKNMLILTNWTPILKIIIYCSCGRLEDLYESLRLNRNGTGFLLSEGLASRTIVIAYTVCIIHK